jgi:anthranilate/para-aminobenzoate synthase component II
VYVTAVLDLLFDKLLPACSPFQAARYHSLVISQTACPEDLEITAWTEDGTIMAVQHKK